MNATRLLALGSLALLAGACTSSSAPAPTVGLRQPAALAVFRGYTLEDPATLRPYLVIANATRNDLTVIDASDDTVVQAPIQLRTLVIPIADRPALLAAASLGDGKADLLVAVSAGDSVLQVVETWSVSSEVHSNPAPLPPEPARAVDLGFDVLALAPLPSPPGTARIAAALADRRVAVVEWARQADADGSIALVASTVSAQLDFQPLALAALPDDGDPGNGVQTEIYAATLDELETAPGSGVFVSGVAKISADLATVSPLDGRGPTRLVAAARLRERAGTSTASDPSAFSATVEPRVYAVLDESGCGRERRIDCGIVTLDPNKTTGGDSIPEDWAGRMAYRAPMRVTGRPLALAVAQPPAVPPPGSTIPADFMRLFDGATERATTGVAAVASDDGNVYFLDLGRFETATATSPVATRSAGTPASETVGDARLWLVRRVTDQDPGTPDVRSFPETAVDAASTLTITPGYTPTETWFVTHQGFLSTDLTGRVGEAGLDGAEPWIALQRGEGPPADGRIVSEVVRLFHPALGVRPGDLVVIKAAGVPGCTGTAPVETSPANGSGNEFEVVIASLLEPSPRYPGGAVLLTPPPAASEAATCYEALRNQIATPGGATRLAVSIRAAELVLRGTATGYAGRPGRGGADPSSRYALEYPATEDEDALAVACPIADWDGRFPVPPDVDCSGGCDRARCEQLVLARKARRLQNLSFPCEDQECLDRFPGVRFPEGNGPALGFEVDVQRCVDGACDPAIPAEPLPLARGMRLTLSPLGGLTPLTTRATGSPFQASGAIAFDRSAENGDIGAAAGYRFLVSYPADMVFDVSPSVTPVNTFVIR